MFTNLEEWQRFDELAEQLLGKSKLRVAREICGRSASYSPESMVYKIKRIFESAEKGDVTCQLIIGKAYYEIEDYQSARVWLQKSADQGNPEAEVLLDGAKIGTGEIPVGSGCMVFVAVLFVSLVVTIIGGVEIGVLI